MKKTIAALAFAALSTTALANTATIYSYDQILTSPEVADPTIYAHVDVRSAYTIDLYNNGGGGPIEGVIYDDRSNIYYTGEGSQPREVVSGKVLINLQCMLSKSEGPGGYSHSTSIAIDIEEGAEYELYVLQSSRKMSVWGGEETTWYSCIPGIRKR